MLYTITFKVIILILIEKISIIIVFGEKKSSIQLDTSDTQFQTKYN